MFGGVGFRPSGAGSEVAPNMVGRYGKSRIGIEMRRIQHDRICCGTQRGRGAQTIAVVTALKIQQTAPFYTPQAPFLQLLRSASGASLDIGGDIELHRGRGTD